MDNKFINTVLLQVRKRMRTFEVPGCGQSRRIEGMFDRDDEVRGFRNLCIYMDSELADNVDELAEILWNIDSYICRQSRHNHNRWLMFFGSDPARLIAPGPSAVHQAIRAEAWKGSIGKYLKGNTACHAIIPQLSNPGSANTHFPDHHSLALFFCRGRNVSIPEDQQKSFNSIRKRSLWFFFGDGDLPEFDASGHCPGVLGEKQQRLSGAQ